MFESNDEKLKLVDSTSRLDKAADNNTNISNNSREILEIKSFEPNVTNTSSSSSSSDLIRESESLETDDLQFKTDADVQIGTSLINNDYNTMMKKKKKSDSDPGARTVTTQEFVVHKKIITANRRKRTEKLEKYTSLSDDGLKGTLFKVKDLLNDKREHEIYSPNIPLPTLKQKSSVQPFSEVVKVGFDPNKLEIPDVASKRDRRKTVETSTFASDFIKLGPHQMFRRFSQVVDFFFK